VLQVLVEPGAVTGCAQDARQHRLPHLDRLAPEIGAVQLQQGRRRTRKPWSRCAAALGRRTGQDPSRRSTPLAVDLDRPHLEVVHGLDHHESVKSNRCDQPDADRVSPSHQPIAVVLDLVNPTGAGRGRVGRGWEAASNEARPVRGQALTHTLDHIQ
jgi:hypothetical protein